VDGQPPLIHGDGEQYRDFVFVADVVRANILAATRPGIGGTVFNIGTGRSVTINRLWDLVCDLAGRRLDPTYGPTRAGDIRESVADVVAAAEALEFIPEHDFQAGLNATFAWYKETRS
jgi:nucleoside-diphosphate-sugar epimerase